MEYFECRGLTASFVPFPKIILSKRDLCTKAERSHRFQILVNGCPYLSQATAALSRRGHPTRICKPQLRHLPGGWVAT